MPRTNELNVPRIDYEAMSFDQRLALEQKIVRKAYDERARVARVIWRKLRRKSQQATVAGYQGLRRLAIHLAAALARWWQAHAERQRRMRSMFELQGLSDYELKDIGLSRSEIQWATRHGRYEPAKPAIEMRRPAVSADPAPVKVPQPTRRQDSGEVKRAA